MEKACQKGPSFILWKVTTREGRNAYNKGIISTNSFGFLSGLPQRANRRVEPTDTGLFSAVPSLGFDSTKEPKDLIFNLTS